MSEETGKTSDQETAEASQNSQDVQQDEVSGASVTNDTIPSTGTDGAGTNEQKVVQEETLRAYMKQADEILNIEEITVVYNGVKQPQNASQLAVELSALRNLQKLVEGRIASLEHDWSVIMEKQRIVSELFRADQVANKTKDSQ